MKEYNFIINGTKYKVGIQSVEDNIAEVEVNGAPFYVEMEKPLVKKGIKPLAKRTVYTHDETTVSSPSQPVVKPVVKVKTGALLSPLPGVITAISVNVGDTVKIGQKVLALEAMKMENNINADKDGKVLEIKVSKGDSVLEGTELIIIG
ncbi:MAG: acetyl-CoA carboxylase biotin carboxyl carrier protein subunit [Paludibacteraceae bacterium]|nr:acetyl-CoA carboxylase biotin carboxyl carrier protein subunit [Paludibacteraceae bacterium]